MKRLKPYTEKELDAIRKIRMHFPDDSQRFLARCVVSACRGCTIDLPVRFRIDHIFTAFATRLDRRTDSSLQHAFRTEDKRRARLNNYQRTRPIVHG